MGRLAALLAALAVAALAASCDSKGQGGATPTGGAATATARATAMSGQTATPAATATPEIETVAGLPVREFRLVEPVALPGDGALLIESGCWACEGNVNSVDRVYRDASGTLRREKLLDPSVEITGIAYRPEATEIVASLCTRGYCGPLNAVTPDAESRLVRSRDGGVTWETIADLPGVANVRAFAGDSFIVDRFVGTGDPREWPYLTYLWPSRHELVPPPGADPYYVRVWQGGAITFRSQDGQSFLRLDGSVYWKFPLGVTLSEYGVRVTSHSSGDPTLVSWSVAGTAPPWFTRYLGVYRGGRLAAVYSGGANDALIDAAAGARGEAWVNADVIAGNAVLDSALLGLGNDSSQDKIARPRPVLVDYAEGTVAPISPGFFKDNYAFNRTTVSVFIPGPFARVVNTGGCLNVRREPSIEAPVVACYADGVLLRRRGDERQDDGVDWLQVATPAGETGWASTQYLER